VEANLLVMRSHPDSLELVMKCQNDGSKMAEHKRSKSLIFKDHKLLTLYCT
jgi:hypothetical protein